MEYKIKKNPFISLLIAALIASFVLPVNFAGAAIRRKDPPAVPRTETSPRLAMPSGEQAMPTGRQACATLKQTSTNITAKIVAQEKLLNKNNDTALQKLVTAQNKQNELLNAQRANQDKLKKNAYAKLDVAAKTETQKQAVAKFKAAVDRAENIRRVALDEIISAFRAGTQNILDERKESGKSAVAELKDTIADYTRTTENNCNSGKINPTMVRAALRSNVSAAQSKLINQRRIINQEAKSSLNTLIQAREQATQKTADDFKTALEKAKADFKQNYKSR